MLTYSDPQENKHALSIEHCFYIIYVLGSQSCFIGLIPLTSWRTQKDDRNR
jgi:hypothetical protein